VGGAGAEHDDAHEQAATAIGSLVERRPGIEEVTPGAVGGAAGAIPAWGTTEEEQRTTPERRTQEDG
jgi:hypothetical protein